MKKLICIVCPNGCHLEADVINGETVVSGNKCPRGLNFAKEELTAPKRSLTTSVATAFSSLPVVSVRTNGDIPKDLLLKAVAFLNTVKLDKKYHVGETVVENLLETDVNVIVTTDMYKALN